MVTPLFVLLLLWSPFLTFASSQVVVASEDSIEPETSSNTNETVDVVQPVSTGSKAPDLPLNEINVLVLTDTHSWVGGHGPKPGETDADYGDVLSFYEHLQRYISSQPNMDLFFVMNGDWIDGTGLAMNGNTFTLTQILQKMPWDAINVGNHELYHKPVLQAIRQPGAFIDWWSGRYLSSNIVWNDTKQPMTGKRYTLLKGFSKSVLVFGFLYNMMNADGLVEVETVEWVVNQTWFANALRTESYDAIIVLAHMGFNDGLVTVINRKIRNILDEQEKPVTPIQFITGHTHIRNYTVLDKSSTSFEAGRFLDTVGFVSFPAKATRGKQVSQPAQEVFHNVFVNATKQILRETIGKTKEEYLTPRGRQLSTLIGRSMEELGLNEVIGCIDNFYTPEDAVGTEHSLWGFFNDHVVASKFQPHEILLIHTGEFRYTLAPFASKRVRVGDVIAAAPFNSSLHVLRNLPGSLIDQLRTKLNGNVTRPVPRQMLCSGKEKFDRNLRYDLITTEFDIPTHMKALKEIGAVIPVHEPLNRYLTSVFVEYVRESQPCDDHDGVDIVDLPNYPKSPGTSKPSTSRGKITPKSSSHKDYSMVAILYAGGLLSLCIFVAFCAVLCRYHRATTVYQRETRRQLQQEEREGLHVETLSSEPQFTIDDLDEDENQLL